MPTLVYIVNVEVDEDPGEEAREFTREEIFRAVRARSADAGILPDESECPGAKEVLLRSITVNFLEIQHDAQKTEER